MSELKGLILCAGEASRLRPVSYAVPKPLFPVANRPLIDYALGALAQAGVTDIGIVISPWDRATPDALGDGGAWGGRATYIEQHQPCGLGHAVAQAAQFVGDSSFVLYLGDTLMDQGVEPAVALFEREDCDAVMLLAEVDDPRRFGVAEVDGTRVVRLVEKPKQPKSNLAVVGAYLLKSCVVDAIGRTTPSARGELEITDSIQTMIASGATVRWLPVDGWWGDVGSPETALETNAHFLEALNDDVRGDVAEDCTVLGPASVGRGTVVRRSALRGPVCIGENCTIEDAEIGPNACLGDGSSVRASTVANAILSAGCSVHGVGGGLTGSVFGERVAVAGTGPECALTRSVLCADSVLQLTSEGADT
ncbi:MAG: glucose-1-phosphate thymidylyltransferase [Armatimonadota bacterium]